MTRIYTKTGDQGETGLFGGGRVAKDDERVDAYGEVDELNAALGLARSFARALQNVPELDQQLQTLQEQLFTVGAVLATPRESAADGHIPHVRPEWITSMEARMDALDRVLPPLTHFVLPGGTDAASALHLARTICRRAERRVIPLHRSGHAPPELLVYLNRLSDLLFTLSRWCNQLAGRADVLWIPPKP
jgi:cob(I)alamin adenosyltransferase